MIIASINYNANAIRIKKTIINKSIKIPKVQITHKTASCFLPFSSQITGRPKIKEPTKATDKTKVLIEKLCDSINLRLISGNESFKNGKKVNMPLCRIATDDGYYDDRIPGTARIGQEITLSLIELYQSKGWSVGTTIEDRVLVFKYKETN